MLTLKEKDELYAKLEKASNEELGQICQVTMGYNPFKSTLLLPSDVRKHLLVVLKKAIKEDKIIVKKS